MSPFLLFILPFYFSQSLLLSFSLSLSQPHSVTLLPIHLLSCHWNSFLFPSSASSPPPPPTISLTCAPSPPLLPWNAECTFKEKNFNYSFFIVNSVEDIQVETCYIVKVHCFTITFFLDLIGFIIW